ncbi:uncharacterized protein LOC123465231 isoform X2 [Bubalus bubalis]|uniref:uncharacterized protein LOC123465231 isoform X2 n=1 Tax=Bubalus bubalis TaxID=89462 RepID=UPI001E1B769D|nr:uncharacterized protein LOC123465231 isoform X2 [Bubalus bubalis]
MLPKAHLTSHSTMSGSRTLGCTPRSSWISPGSDHYMAREIAPQRDKKDRACQNQGLCLFYSLPPKGSPSLGLLETPQVATCRPSLLNRDQTWPSSPSPAPGVCFVNTSVEQERTKPARTKSTLSSKENRPPRLSQPCVWRVFSTPQWNKKGAALPEPSVYAQQRDSGSICALNSQDLWCP